MTPAEALLAKLEGIADSLERAEARTPEEHDRVRATAAELSRLVELLAARGVLGAGDVKLMQRLGESVTRPRVRLSLLADKYTTPSEPIDCFALLPLCRGRCCAFEAPLSAQDLAEGTLRWQIDDPYLLRRAADGYCEYLGEHGCTQYEARPATCRAYDCREDRRVWIDFEKKIPAPMPDGVTPRY